jgi:large subunit ribosomal protein L23
MRTAHDILIQPLITEKSTRVREGGETYCFKVHVNANKIEIAKAVEQLFAANKVKVAAVRTSRVQGKLKRVGRYTSRKPEWKKAWVRLVPGSKGIELFEGA